jgi:alpha-1,3/alpha-1,6-mannosyltransferase
LDFFRYERKKNIALAISALQHFKTLQHKAAGDVKRKKVLLVVAGGYDIRVTENVEYLKVVTICAQLWAFSDS